MNDRKIKWLILLFGVFLVVKLTGDIIKVQNAGGRVVDEEKKLATAQELNGQLKKQLLEVETPQFMEREAREKLGYGKPGEVVLILPEPTSSNSGVYKDNVDTEANWIKWRKLYLGF